MALYSTSRKIEMVEILAVLSIHWCTCEVDSYKIMFLAPYPMTKLFEFYEVQMGTDHNKYIMSLIEKDVI